MKRILLSSAAVFAFAGAAAADGHIGVSFSGSAELGYNDTDHSAVADLVAGNRDADDAAAATLAVNDNFGFYSDFDINIAATAELDNGLTAGVTMGLDDFVASGGSNNGVNYELSLTSATSGLYYGDTNFAAQNVWVSAGDMESDGFSEADGEEVLRGEATFGNVSAQMSYAIGTRVAGATDAEQLSLGLSADFGNVNVVAAYQDMASAAYTASRGGGGLDLDGDTLVTGAANGDFNGAEVFGISVGTSFSGADVRIAYADNSVSNSTGVRISYPFGPVTATAYYVSESVGADNWGINMAYANGPIAITADYQDDQGTEDWGLEGSYDVGNGLVIYAGVDDSGDDYYVGGEYDLGSGAALTVSFADDSDGDEDSNDDDIGARDYQVGTTVEVSFAF